MNQSVRFYFNDVHITLKEKTRLKKFLLLLFKSEGCFVKNINVVFCTDSYLLDINTAFLKHDYFTDIVTFSYSNQKKFIDGELYISAERIRENSQMHKTSLKEELHRVIFHGCLHLCGYRDKTSQEIKKMRERENYYLRLYHIKRS
ncbi:MAG: rRNA maturation RNase YbeY [Chitinophagaceae bacterium]